MRKVKTASGATAVQIARKHRGVRTIVEHIGSAHDDTQLAVLVQIAKERIMAGQLAFDLDALTPTAPTGVAPIVTLWASLATLLWRERCERAGVRIDARRFAVHGLILAVPATVLAVLVL